MRTDAKIGFAIGGVLLAVLTVYAIVVPKHKKTTNTTVSLVQPPPMTTTATDGVVAPMPTIPTPPMTSADAAVTSTKDTVTTPVVTPTPSTPTSTTPLVDNTPTPPVDGFHPLIAPKGFTKSDEKPGKLVDGVYTPDNGVPTKAHKSSHTISPLPDDTADASTGNDRVYTIKSGQTLSKIAYEVYGNSRFWVAIQRENKGLDSNHLKVGSKINLPEITPVASSAVTVADEEVAPESTHTAAVATNGHSYTVKSGDSLYGIARRLLGSGHKAEALYALNKDVIGPDKSRLKLGMVLKLPQGSSTELAVNHVVR
jgi:nucleoid-associated protein YgaU